MSLARRRKRRIVVGGYTWWYRADFSYDQLWTDGGGMLIVRDDRKVQLWLTAPGRGNVNRCLARVVAPTLPWFASQPKFTAYEVPLNIAPGWTPGVVAKVIAWCLDATAERVAVPSPWLVAPALPDERTVEGFVARLLNPSGRDLQRAVEVAEEVLDRPLIARPLDPVARDLPRSRRLIARVWETLAVRGIIPNDWAGDSPRGFVASVERALEGEPVTAVDERRVALCTPPSLRCALALASDVGGVLRAESLARDWVGRFEAGRANMEQREVRWHVVGDAYADASALTVETLRETARREWEEAEGASPALREVHAPRMDLWRSGYALDLRTSGLALAAPDIPFE